MTVKNYYKISGLVFMAAGTLHLLRALFGWKLILNNWEVPMWLSVAAAVILGYLSYRASKLAR